MADSFIDRRSGLPRRSARFGIDSTRPEPRLSSEVDTTRPSPRRSSRFISKRSEIITEPAETDPELQARFQSLKEQFPGIRGLDVKLKTGEGPGFAEVFPVEEGRNPIPGHDVIEIRNQNLPENELRATILGEALHFLPERNKQFGELKNKFIKSMRPEQIRVMREMHEDAKEQFGDKRSFDEFVRQSAADAFIRDWVFQEIGAIPGGRPFIEGLGPVRGAFFDENVGPLREIMRFLLEGGKKEK